MGTGYEGIFGSNFLRSGYWEIRKLFGNAKEEVCASPQKTARL